MFALREGALISEAYGVDFTKQHGLSKIWGFSRSDSAAAVGLSAHNFRDRRLPLTGAHSVPFAIVVDFHSAITPIGSIDHSHMFCK